MINNFDISAIEDAVRGVIEPLGISKNVYPNRPKAAEPATDFVVVKVGGSIVDKYTYGECVVHVDLFAKDVNNIKNKKKLSVMYQKFIKGFPASAGNLLFDTDLTILGDTPDDYGYHARMIRIKTTIKAI
jgi:hypothetical protein